MDLTPVRSGIVLELLVMFFQLVGLTTLVMSRLLPHSGWRRRIKLTFLLSLLGLGAAGAVCSHHTSSMGLFAGGTLTFLLVGMIMGSAPGHPHGTAAPGDAIEPTLAA